MGSPKTRISKLVGRDSEIESLRQCLARTLDRQGPAVFISGEAGIGKTRLVEEFQGIAEISGFTVLSGSAEFTSTMPFQVLSKALGDVVDRTLFDEQELRRFDMIFAVNGAGMLMAQSSSHNDMDADIFAGMLTAVQSFVRDSFDSSGVMGGSIGRLEYGDMKMLIEHGKHVFLVTVVEGGEHPEMKAAMKRSLLSIESGREAILGSWTGNMSDISWVQDEVDRLSRMDFLVRRELSGIKLQNERARMADRMLDALKRNSEICPMAIILEDLQWADESSIFTMGYLARNLQGSRILLIGTFRPGESINLEKTIGELRESGSDFMELERLSMPDSLALISGFFTPNDFPANLSERLFQNYGGNPMFMEEMLRQMLADGSVSQRDGIFTLISDSFSTPATVEEIVARRLDSLDPNSMAMAEYASCIGQVFDSSLTFSLRTLPAPSESVEMLVVMGILSRSGDIVKFSHAVFQSVIYDGMSERWRIAHHKAIGEHMESISGNDDSMIYDLARHFSRARVHSKSAEYCIRAGEKAEIGYAMEQALGYYNLALEALPKLGDIGRENMVRERTGDIRSVIGDYEGAIADFTNSSASAVTGEEKVRLLRKVGEVHERRADYDQALEALTAAIQLAPEQSSEKSRISLSQGMVHYRLGDNARAMAMFNSVISLPKADSDPKILGTALKSAGNIHYSTGDLDSAMEFYGRSLETMEKAKDIQGMAGAMNNMGMVHHLKGELGEALEWYARCLDMMEKMGDKWGIATTLNNIGIVQGESGNPEEAMEHHKRSLTIREKLGDKRGVSTSYSNMGFLYSNMGDLEKAIEYQTRSLRLKEKIGDKEGAAYSQIYIAGNMAELNEHEKAVEAYGSSLEKAREMDNRRLIFYNLQGMAELELRRGIPDKAMELAVEAMAIAREMDVDKEIGMAHRLLGAIKRYAGDWQAAEDDFAVAERIFKAMDDSDELAYLDYDRGILSRGMGDLKKARELLDSARRRFEEMGIRFWAEKCGKALEEMDG